MCHLNFLKTSPISFITIPLLLFIATQGLASPNPDSELLRQQERQKNLIQKNQTTPNIRLEMYEDDGIAERIPKKEIPCFHINNIVLKNFNKINDIDSNSTNHKFSWALDAAHYTKEGIPDSATHRCLGSKGINLIMKRIQNAIVAKGYVTTRILAMPQDLKTGQLTLTIVPGKIRNIRFKTPNPRATYSNAIPSRKDNLLNLRDIEQALENFKRLPTVETDIQIQPTTANNAQPGESDLEIAWRQSFPFRLNFFIDNSGSKTTGKYLGGATFSYDHFLTLNDLLYISVNQDLGGGIKGARGTKGKTFHYSVPYGYWLISFTASQNNYHQTIIGDTPYTYSGESENAEIKLSKLTYRDAKRKTTSYLSGWVRESQNFINDTEIEVQRRRMAGLEIGVNHQEYIDSTTLNLGLAYRWGVNAMNAIDAPEEPFGEGTSKPRILKFNSNLNYPFTVSNKLITYQNQIQIQRNLTPLVPQDRFSIGSRYTVRGFDGENTLTGDYGWLIRNNLLTSIGKSNHQAYVGLDYGSVGGQSTTRLNNKDLSGMALGIKGNFKNLYYDAFFARYLIKPKNIVTASPVFNFNLNWAF